MDDINKNYKVRLRGGFADRNNIELINKQMQYNDLDERTRIKILNIFNDLLNYLYPKYEKKELRELFRCMIMSEVYVEKVDWEVRNHIGENEFIVIENTFLNDNYADVLTLLEYVVDYFNDELENIYMHNVVMPSEKYNIFDDFNKLFEDEFVGYRFVNKQIIPITNNTEIQEIEQAVNTPYHKVDEHISKAINYLSDRDNPDYENSIKESISAVEAMCSIILGEKGNLGQTLNKLEATEIKIHPSMKEAFKKLYGYTSDATGIRHAGDIGGASSTFEEAKFMLVTCSAFINYLIGVTSK